MLNPTETGMRQQTSAARERFIKAARYLALAMYATVLWGQMGTRPRVVISSDFPPVDVIPGSLNQGPPEKRSDPDD
ncbi:MAG TPA: hypothetical protein VES20_19115, partial [Bryobacteraceae bacterium]|nr:hypothetical protein [Bryobacteraceae bacterium]